MTVHTFTDRHRGKVTEVDGDLIAEADSRDYGRPGSEARARWNQMELYELSESGDWLLHRFAESVIYHAADTTCETNRGDRSGLDCAASELPGDAEPCWNCRPPARGRLADGDRVRYEFTRHSFTRCGTAGQVRAKLENRYERGAEGRVSTSGLSGPAEGLVRAAVLASPRFRDEYEMAVAEAERIA